MKTDSYSLIGFLAKKYSYKGELLAKLYRDTLVDNFLDASSIFVNREATQVPYRVERARLHNRGLIRLKFEEISTEEEADNLIGSSLYLPKKMLQVNPDKTSTLHEVLLYEVIDYKLGHIGSVTHIDEGTIQPIIIIGTETTEVLVPWVEEFVKKIDHKEQKIYLTTPDGLLSLYKG